MKISTPRTKVASIAPTLDLMFFFAHSPNAALPPALLTRATIAPSTTRKMKIPAVPDTAAIRPSFTTASTVLRTLKFAAKRPPISIPMNNELYTSFVIRASPIAITGGTSDQNVPAILLVTSPSSAKTAKGHSTSSIITVAQIAKRLLFLFIIIFLLFFDKKGHGLP